MNKPITYFILMICFYLSLIRASNIGLFYPTNEMLLPSIDYTLPKVLNLFLLLGLVSYVFLLNDYSFLRKVFKDFMLLALGGCALLSVAVSVNKVESIKYIVAIIVMSFPAIVYIEKYGTERYLKALSYFFVGMAFANIAYQILMPQYAIMSGNHAGKWRGLFEHKNTAGAFFAISFYIIFDQFKKKTFNVALIPIVAMLIAFVFVVMAQSTTALIAFVSIGFLYFSFSFLYRLAQPSERLIVLLFILSFGLAMAVLAGPYIMSEIFQLTGKDATLTGRTNIWAPLIEMSFKSPLLGYGFGMAERAEFILLFNNDIGFEARSTHNSFLDLIIGMGYPAAIIFIGLILRTLFQSLLTPINTVPWLQTNVLAMSIFIVMIIIAFSMGGVFLSRTIFWQFSLIAFLILARYSRLRENS